MKPLGQKGNEEVSIKKGGFVVYEYQTPVYSKGAERNRVRKDIEQQVSEMEVEVKEEVSE